MFCSKCGAALAANSAFCQTCGNPVAPVYSATAGAISPHAGVGAIAYAANVVYAGFWLRFAAFLIDSLIVGAATIALIVPFFFLIGGAAWLETLPRHRFAPFESGQLAPFLTTIFTLAAISLLLKWLYFAYLESGEQQGTWGKMLLGIYVTDLSGQRLTFGRASGRFFAKMVSGLVPLWIGYIMAGFTERRQALHDMIASCLVLRR